MMKMLNITGKNPGKASVILTIAFMLLMIGCYELKTVYQPTQAEKNSSFESTIVATGLEGNRITSDSATIAHLGIMLPEGWVVQEPVKVIKVSTVEGYDDTDSIWYDQSHVDNLNTNIGKVDSLTPPEGYYWWGGSSRYEVDFYELDTAFCVATILTDDSVGDFFLVYAIGDGGTAIDDEGVSKPMPVSVGKDPLGINDKSALTELSFYPNPSPGYINVDLKNRTENASLQILNTNGQTILEKNDLSESNYIDLSELNNGIYIVVLDDRGTKNVQKLLVQK